MNRNLRLKSSTDFKRVRQDGETYSHPLVVLFAIQNQLDFTRIGVAAGKRMGNAVTRNMIKRRLRAILSEIHESLKPGWDILVIARTPSRGAAFQDLKQAVSGQLLRAGLMSNSEL